MKFLSLNTWQERGPWKKRWEIIFRGIEKYNPEIIAFQEVFNSVWAEQIVKRTGYPHSVFPSDPSGLMILSRFPVLSRASLKMKTQSPTEPYFRYGLFAELQMKDFSLAVFNTHLSWMLDEGRVREKQVGELLEFMEMKADGLETLAAGDFNSTVKTAEILKMVGEGRFADTFASLYPDSPGLTWDNQNPYAAGSNHPLPDRRIDYIFLRPSLNKRLKLKSAEVILTSPDEAGIFASDHYGLLAAFNENWSK